MNKPVKPTQTVVGDGKIISSPPPDTLFYGVHVGEWEAVVEEAPQLDKLYGRRGGGLWEEIDPLAKLSVTEVVPAIAQVGMTADLPATLYGNGFTATTVVNWNGVALATPAVYVDPNTMTFTVTVAMAATVGVFPVTVVDGATIGTGAAGFHVLDVAKTLAVTEIVPTMSDVNIAADLSARVYGTGFTATTVAQWTNAAAVTTPMATTFVDANTLNVTITSAMTAVPGIYTVTAIDGALIGKGGAGFHILPIPAGLQITSLIPDEVIVPSTTPLLVSAYGAMFTPTCVCVVSYQGAAGVDQVTNFVSVSELTFTVDPTPFPTDDFVTVTVRDTATGEVGAGAEQFSFVTVKNSLYRGRWDPQNNVPDIGGLAGKELEWMWTVDLADPLVPIAAPPNATGIAGTLCQEGDHAVWTGAAFILVTKAAGGLYQGRYQPATNAPDIVALTPKQDKWMWVVDAVDPLVPETPLVALPGITTTLREGDHLVWEAATSTFLLITNPGFRTNYGIGLSITAGTPPDPPIVNLQPAGDSPATLGGVYVVDRARTISEGLELGIDGKLRSPLATDLLAGSIVEPPPDDKRYERTRTPAGVSSWVEADNVLYQGLWQPNANSPDLAAIPNKLAGWMWIADTVDSNVPENAPATLPAIGGLSIDEGDHIVWDGTMFQLVQGNAQGLYRGRWRPQANVPDIGALTKQAEWTWTADVADPMVPELAPAGLPGIGGLAIYEGDHVVWDGTTFILISRSNSLTVTEVIPSFAECGSPVLQARVYGSGFTATSRVLWDGGVIPSTFIDSTKLRIDIDPTNETVPRFVTVTVEDGPSYGISANGSGGFYFILPAVDYGIGLAVSPGAPGVPPDPNDPPIVNLTPAGDSPATLGGVYVVDRARSLANGLELGLDGQLKAPPATDTLLGTFVEPPQDGLDYSRRYYPAAAAWGWEPALTPGLHISEIVPDKAVIGPGLPPVLVHVFGGHFTATTTILLDGVSAASTLFIDQNHMTYEALPANEAVPRTVVVTIKDDAGVGPGAGADAFDFIISSTNVDYGTGLALDTTSTPPIVNLTPSGPEQKFLGGTWTPPRTATQGISLYPGADPALLGQLTGPLATDELAGTIVEPAPDDKKYSRTRTPAGVSSWVLADNLAVTEIIPDNALCGSAPIRARIYGSGFTATTRVYWDGVIIPHTWLDDTKLQIDVDPSLETVERYITVTAEDGPSGNISAMGSAGFYFTTVATAVDYGVGLSLDAGATPADNQIVNLTPAGPDQKFLGGVWTPPRTDTQGLSLYAGADPLLLGQLTAPLATDLLAGVHLEPGPNGKQHARVNTGGVMTWVEVTASGVYISDTPPAPQPPDGSLWFESDTGAFFILYNDGNTTQWVEIGGGGGSKEIFSGDTPPATPVDDTCWFESDTGAFHVRYNDGNSSQWVEVGNAASSASKEVFTGDTAPATPADDTLWFDSLNGNLYIRYNDGTSAQWVMTDLGEAPLDGQMYARRNAAWVVTTVLAADPAATTATNAKIVALEACCAESRLAIASLRAEVAALKAKVK